MLARHPKWALQWSMCCHKFFVDRSRTCFEKIKSLLETAGRNFFYKSISNSGSLTKIDSSRFDSDGGRFIRTGSLPGEQRLPFGIRFRRDCAVLDRPIQETCGRVLDPKYVCQFYIYTLDLLPFRVFVLRKSELRKSAFARFAPSKSAPLRFAPGEVSVLQSRV